LLSKTIIIGFIAIFCFNSLASEASSLAIDLIQGHPQFQMLSTKTWVPPKQIQLDLPEIPKRTFSRMSYYWDISKTANKKQVYITAKNAATVVLDKLRKQGILLRAQSVAKLYGINYKHIIGPILGEGVFNPASIERKAQDTVASILQAAKYNGRAENLLKNTVNGKCLQLANEYLQWNCVVESQGETIMILGAVDLRDPLVQSFGLGQLSPIRALMMTDLLHKISGFGPSSGHDVSGAFSVILDDTKILHAIAASAVVVIEVYKHIAGFDLSSRPDLTTTLYNVGSEVKRAAILRKKLATDHSAQPVNNYMGHFVQMNLELIDSFVD